MCDADLDPGIVNARDGFPPPHALKRALRARSTMARSVSPFVGSPGSTRSTSLEPLRGAADPIGPITPSSVRSNSILLN